MRTIISRPALLLPLLLIPIAAYATTHIFAEALCQLWLPENGWYRNSTREQGSPWMLAAVDDEQMTRSVIVTVTKLSIGGGDVEAYVRKIYDGIGHGISKHAKIIHAGGTKLDGVPAWEVAADEMSGGTSYVICAIANDRLYTISARWKKGDAEKDEDLRSIVESFRFLGRPELPRNPGRK
jgi:hypothetical protein